MEFRVERFEPRAIYEYPVVQYIPLWIETISQQPGKSVTDKIIEPVLLVSEQAGLVAQWIAEYADTATQNLETMLTDRLMLLALHMWIGDINYRAEKVTLVGRLEPGGHHLFSITTRYFYRKRLYFAAYDLEGKQLASTIYTLQTGARR